MATWNLNGRIAIYSLQQGHRGLIDVLDMPEVASGIDNVLLDIAWVRGTSHLLIGSNVGQPVIVDLVSRKVVQRIKHAPGQSRTEMCCICRTKSALQMVSIVLSL